MSTGFSYGVVELVLVRRRDGSAVAVDEGGRVWWSEGVSVGPVERRVVEGTRAPRRSTRRKRVTIDSFRVRRGA